MGKSKKQNNYYQSRKTDERKQANRALRKQVREMIKMGQYEDLPEEAIIERPAEDD